MLRLSFPYGDLGRETGAIVALTDRDGVFGRPAPASRTRRLTWTYADDRANDEQPRDPEVDRAVARLFAARARQEAVLRNRSGDFVHARSAISSVAERIRSYAGRDPELRELVRTLEAEQACSRSRWPRRAARGTTSRARIRRGAGTRAGTR